MRNIKILNLYNEALELNGDTMNVTAFTNRLDEMGYGYEISTAGVGEEADFSAFDIVFVCHGKPHNVSAVIMADKPKLSGYIPRITEKLAAALGLSPDRVGIGATTLEGLGFIGREDGICVRAAATVIKI